MNDVILISLRAPKGVGKTTAAEYLCKEHGFTRISFADPLKDLAKRVTIDGRIDKARDRGLLQFLGTEYYRSFDTDHWTKQWSQRVTERIELTNGTPRIVVDDSRFDNEEAAVGFFGGKSAWIHGPTHIEEYSGIPAHVSEQTVFRPEIDYPLYNNGKLKDFYPQLDIFARWVIACACQGVVDRSRCDK